MNLITRKPRPATVVCADCNSRGRELADVYDARETLIRERVSQATLHCRNCGAVTHLYFDSPALKEEKAKLAALRPHNQAQTSQEQFEAYKRAVAVYQRKFDTHNRRWERKLGIDPQVSRRVETPKAWKGASKDG